MTDPGEVPTLGVGGEQRQLWQQVATTLAYAVRGQRHGLDQPAWSDAETAARTQERTERVADPAVRAMSTDEWAEAVDRRQQGQGGERHTQSGDGWVTVWVGPMNDGRIALLASAARRGRAPRRLRPRSAASTPRPPWNSRTRCSAAARSRSTGCTPSPPWRPAGPPPRPARWRLDQRARVGLAWAPRSAAKLA